MEQTFYALVPGRGVWCPPSGTTKCHPSFSKPCINMRELRGGIGFSLARSAIRQRSHAHIRKPKKNLHPSLVSRWSGRVVVDTAFSMPPHTSWLSMPPHTSWRTVARMHNHMGLRCKEVRCTSCNITLAGFKQCLEAAAARFSRHLA